MLLCAGTLSCATASSRGPQRSARPPRATVGGDLLHGPATLWHDAADVFADGSNLLILSGALGLGLIQEATLDEREDTFFDEHTLYSSSVRDLLGALGSGYFLFGANAVWSLTALAEDDEASYDDSKLLLRSLALTSVATLALKATVDDKRPNGGAKDFPSGHASLSMAAAATLDELYGAKAGVPAYTASVLIGLQRLDTQHHDSESVLFGFALGWVIGHTIAGAPVQVLGMDVELMVNPADGTLGLGLVRNF